MILDYRQGLRQRLADSITAPDFEALTTLDPGDGKYLSIDSLIREGSNQHEPIKMEFKRNERKDDWVDYTLTLDGQKYFGHITLTNIEEKGVEAEAEVHLDRRGLERVNCRDKKGTRELIGMDHLKQIKYWVPSIINHVAKHADSYLRGYRQGMTVEGLGGEKAEPGNKYRLVFDDSLDRRASPHMHFREPHERQVGNIDIKIRGAYVRPEWGKVSEDDVVGSIREHRHHIEEDYFKRTLLPDILKAGHNKERIEKAYLN